MTYHYGLWISFAEYFVYWGFLVKICEKDGAQKNLMRMIKKYLFLFFCFQENEAPPGSRNYLCWTHWYSTAEVPIFLVFTNNNKENPYLFL